MLIRDNKIPEAEQQLNGILKTAPNDAVALNLMGTIRAQQGRLNEAEGLMTRAAKIDPAFVAVHMNLVFSLPAQERAGENHFRIERSG